MFIKFESLKFKNIMSYGNKITEIKFEKSFNLITGKNGEGKSGGFAEPLTYCLYGQPYRSIKIAKLLNRTNKKDLYTECSFFVGSDNYKIIRTMKPDSLDIIKNNQSVSLLSSKRLSQDEIDKILGVNYKMFKQIISLASNYNKPYLTLPAQDKRDIIESIFNIKIFGGMVKIAKKKISDLKTQIEIDDNTIKLMESNLANQNRNLKEIKQLKVTFDKEKTEEKEHLEGTIKATKELIDEGNKVLDDLTTEIDKFKEIEQQKVELNQKIKDIDNEIMMITNDKFKFNSINDQLTSLVVELVKKNEDSLKTMEQIDGLKKQIKELELNTKDINELQISFNKIREDISALKYDVKTLEADKKVLDDKICPTCKREIDEEYKTKKLQEIEHQLNVKIKTGTIFTEERDKLQESISKKTEDQANCLNFKTDLRVFESDYKNSFDSIKELSLKQEQLKKEMEAFDIKKIEETEKTHEKNKLEFDSKLQALDVSLKQEHELEIKFSSGKSKKDSLEYSLADLSTRLENIIKKTFEADIEALQKSLDTECEKYKVVYKKQENQNDELKNYKFVVDILSEDGIKSYFLKKLMPVLNQSVNEYLQKFDLPVQLQFNEKMEETLSGLSGYKEELEYYSFSSGERTRIDVAILFGFISVTKMIANFNCNLLVVDELIDQNLDTDGLEKMLDSLRNIVDISNSLSCYVISHKASELKQCFDSIIQVEKVNGFSQL